MVNHTGYSLADAGQALLAGLLQQARERYEACADETPHLAALGLTLTCWSQGDFRGVRAHAEQALKAAGTVASFPVGFVKALDGLALIHAGAIREGLALQAAGVEEARRRADGSELNAAVAHVEGQLVLGRWAEADVTITGLRPLAAESGSPLVTGMLDRLALALAVLSEAPAAGPLAVEAVESAKTRDHAADLAVALRWQGEWLLAQNVEEACGVLEAAAVLANQTGQHLVAAEALLLLATHGPATLRVQRLAAARRHAQAGGCTLVDLAAAARQGGRPAREAAAERDALLAPLDSDERAAFMRWPGRDFPVLSAEDDASIDRLAAILASIHAQPDSAAMLQDALASFVAVADAERGFLLRLAGFEVIDQIIHGAAPDSYSTSLADRVVWTGEPLVAADLESDVELGGSASIRALGLRTALGMPLIEGGEVVGVMLADSREARSGFSSDALAMARAIAEHVVVAVQNAERMERLQAAQDADAALGRAALAAAQATRLEDALPFLAIEAAAVLGTSRLFLYEGAGLTCRAALDGGGMPLEAAQPSMGVVRWVAEKGQVLILLDAQAEAPLDDRPSIRELTLRAVHATPILVGSECLGVLYLDSQDPGLERAEAARVLRGLAAIVGAMLRRERD